MSSDRTLDDFGSGPFKTTGHATESTILDLFIEELGKKVKVLTQLSYPQLSGRKQPDATIGEKQDYFIEAEWEGNETKGLVQAARYQRLGGKGIFVVMFPSRLRRSMPRQVLIKQAQKAQVSVISIFNDDRSQDFFSGTLAQITGKISVHVLKEIPVAEVKTAKVISIIQKAVDYISASLVGVTEESLDEVFGGKSVFDNILQYEEKKYPLKEMRKGAAYLLVNQILFYHLLSRARPVDFEEMEEEKIQSLAELQGYFDKVLKIDYRPTFGFKIATKLPKEALDPVKETVNIVKALKPEKIQQEVLGKIFHELIPFEVRKAVAAFYTNNEAGALLANLAIQRANDKVIDLACGSGTLLVCAYQRKKELTKEGKKFTPNDHVRFLESELTGVDVMPFAAHLAAVHLSLREPLYETQRVRLAVWDSTEPTVRPGRTIPTISRELRKAYARPRLDVFSNQSARSAYSEDAYIDKGSVNSEGVGGDAISLEPVDVVIMNPPFTRQERIPEEYKNKLAERFRQYGHVLSGQVGLHGYFILLGDMFLKDGGRLAFVLPATVLRLQSMEGIRKFLVKKYRLDYIVSTEQRSAFSEAARFREILLVATKTSRGLNRSKCVSVNLKRIPVDAADADFLADEILSSRSAHQEMDDPDLSTRFVSQSELEASAENWFDKLIVQKEETLLDVCLQQAPEILKPFSQILEQGKGKIVRGIEHWTGQPVSVSSAFILASERHALKKDDKWIVKEVRKDSILVRDRFVNLEVAVPRKATAPALRRPSGLQSIDVSDDLDSAVVSRFLGDQHFFMKGLVQKGKNLSDYVKKWRKYLESRKTVLMVSRRFNLSAPNTAAMAFSSDRPVSPCKMFWAIQGLNAQEAKIMSLWFNSTINISQILAKRAETEGAFMGLDQYILQEFLVPDPISLSHEQRDQLVRTFDEQARIKMPSILDQLRTKNSVRRSIDLAFLRALGVKGDHEELLNRAYISIEKNIETLATLMKEGQAED